jgi:hypothetical protein
VLRSWGDGGGGSSGHVHALHLDQPAVNLNQLPVCARACACVCATAVPLGSQSRWRMTSVYTICSPIIEPASKYRTHDLSQTATCGATCSWVLLRTELVAVQIIPHCATRFDDHLLAAVAELYHGERVSSKALAEVSAAGVTLAATTEREQGSTTRVAMRKLAAVPERTYSGCVMNEPLMRFGLTGSAGFTIARKP